MEDVVAIDDVGTIKAFEKLRLAGAFLRTPNVQEVVYFTCEDACKRIVRGTIQTNGTWRYEYVPAIGY